MKLVLFGSSLVSAYWNGAATYYRGICKAMHARGHEVVFVETDLYERQLHRDLVEDPPYAEVRVCFGWADLRRELERARDADVVAKCSGIGGWETELARGVLDLQSPHTRAAFWDVDAPQTLAAAFAEPVNTPATFRSLIPQYDLILLYGGGPPVQAAYSQLGAKRSVLVYNAVDPDEYYPVRPDGERGCDLLFMGNRMPDRESRVHELFFEAALRAPDLDFVLGGNGWGDCALPANVRWIGHVPTREHRSWNCSARMVLNINRADMAATGYSPPTRVFEAAGCGCCVITDAWDGISTFFSPDAEILVASSADEIVTHLRDTSPSLARAIGTAARQRVAAEHTYTRRAAELEPEFDVRSGRGRPMTRSLVVFGLSLSSSWGSGHGATYRGLLRALAARGWSITFFERDVEWYRSNRDLPNPDFCDLRLYDDQPDAAAAVRAADVVMVGSFVPDGVALIDWLRGQGRPLFFYDIDTPITLVQLGQSRATQYLRADQVRAFETYFSFAGGPALRELEQRWGSLRAEALYCAVDTSVYRPVPMDERFSCTLSYVGTYAADRQPAVDDLFFAPARVLHDRRFFLPGAQYPPELQLPSNVVHQVHVYPRDHSALYCSSRATLNLTRQSMRQYGWAPSTRLFEAAASGACIISDTWPGLDTLLHVNREVLIATTTADVLRHLLTLSPERVVRIGDAARERVLREHTYERRAVQVEAAFDRALRVQWASAS